MARILYDDGKKIGEISEWVQKQDPPAYKTFLGKTVLMAPTNDECSFVSPKLVSKKSKLTVIEDSKIRYVLEIVKVIGGTQVAAKIKEQTEVTKSPS